MDSELHAFLEYWFAGLMQGLDELDDSTRKKILHRCGSACAHAYTVQIFQDASAGSADMATFLRRLAQRLPGAHYELTDPTTITVTYSQCGCDLVQLGLVRSPDFCECTTANLRENFQQALGRPVSVTLEASILRGDARCVLTVSLD